ncbi:MAG TPA: hypothetical protein VM933_02255, partial [Acidimicrobiales bacterium]|nr:hypothetical protein [Acidimicrobiales bacterium]
PPWASTTPPGRTDDLGPDDDTVVALSERRPVTPLRRRLLSVAAVLLVVSAAVATFAREQESPRVRVAGPGIPTATSTTPTTSGPATTLATPTTDAGPGAPTPDAALLAWIDAVGAGDIPAAIALTGPRSAAYVDALTGGAGLDGFLVEAGEGYGAWADSPDRKTTEVELDPSAGEEITVVILTGTWTGEGGPGFRTDAIPVVRTRGRWVVEPWAIDPATGGRIEVLSPSPAEEDGFNGLDPGGVLTASAPGRAGTFHFSLDDAPATAVPGTPAGGRGGVRATFDPPGELSSGTHLLLIAYVDGQTISAVSGTFAVES